MSTLKADTIVASDGTSPVTLTKQSAAKAWVNLDGTGTIAARDSFNTSSFTDNGTSDYTTSFSSSMSNDDYAVPAQSTANGNSYTIDAPKQAAAANITTSSIRSLGTDYNGNINDHHFVHISILGDLA